RSVMSEKAKNSAAHLTIEDPPEYNAENDKQPHAAHPASKAGRMGTGNISGADWLGGPQNGNETPGKSPEGAYQQNGQSWLGGPQNGKTWEYPFKTASGGSDYAGNPNEHGNKTPGTSTEGAYQSTAHSTGYTDKLGSTDWLGGPQNGNELPGNGGNGGNGGNAYGSGNAGN